MRSRPLVRALFAVAIVASVFAPASAAANRFVAITNGTPKWISARFTSPITGAKVGKGNDIGPFNGLSFELPDVDVIVHVTASGCGTMVRALPRGRNAVVLKEGCDLSVR
jgi:hypothetical protein